MSRRIFLRPLLRRAGAETQVYVRRHGPGKTYLCVAHDRRTDRPQRRCTGHIREYRGCSILRISEHLYRAFCDEARMVRHG